MLCFFVDLGFTKTHEGFTKKKKKKKSFSEICEVCVQNHLRPCALAVKKNLPKSAESAYKTLCALASLR